MLSDNLDDYMELSVPAHDAKFEEMMKNMNITLKPASNPPSCNALDILKSKKCDKVCQNHILFHELDEFFNSTKRKSTQGPSTSESAAAAAVVSCSKTTNDTADMNRLVKISVDDSSGDLIFETNFRPKRNNDQVPKNDTQYYPGPSSSSFGNRNLENRITTEPSSNYIPSSSGNTHTPFGGFKRKQYDSDNHFVKKSAHTANLSSIPNATNTEQNPFLAKCDFRSATEELMNQYHKKHQNTAANQSDNFSYNTHPNGGLKRSLGGRRTINSQFVPPFAHNSDNNTTSSTWTRDDNDDNDDKPSTRINMNHPRLKNVDAKMIETISNEIMHQCECVG